MILEKDYADVQSQGFSSTKVAEIKATPQMLRMLSSGIYSDKISAFIRELSTNAYDAMIEAGTINDKTFLVHLPTKLEPWFTIRDFGTGLSSNGMETNFSNFGDGTKAESNAYNGAFGLGSKSPLSYVRDFTITSYYGGKKTLYNYGKNDEDIPMLSTAYSMDSDEHPGLEITIAIQNSDIAEVVRKAELIYRYFDKRPETNIILEYHELPKIIKGDGWYLTKPDTRNNNYGGNYEVSTPARVVMGNVIYPISSSGLASDSIIYPLTSTPFVIQAELGDVQMTPSRESLELTPKTIKFLESKFKIIMTDIGKDIEKNLDQSLSSFDKVISSFDVMRVLPSSIKGCQIGKFLVSSRTYDSVFDFPKDFFNTCKFKRYSTEASYSHRKTEEYSQLQKGWRPVNTLDYMFVVVDSKKRIGTIIDGLKAKHKQVYVIRPAEGILGSSKEFADQYKAVLKAWGDPKHIIASVEEAKLPPVVRAKPHPKVAGYTPAPRLKGTIKGRRLSAGNGYVSRAGEMSILGSDTGTYYYLESFRGEFIDDKGNRMYSLNNIMPQVFIDLEAKLGSKLNFIELNNIYAKKVKDDTRFKSVLAEVKNSNFIIEVSKDKDAVQEAMNKFYFDSNVKSAIAKRKNCKLGELFKLVNGVSNDRNAYYKSTFEAVGYVFKEINSVDLTEHKEALIKYKDLECLNYKATPEIVEEFIQLIDNRQNKLKQKD